MRLGFASALILCLILWPASADLSDVEPIVNYVLPADIMLVEFADETWVYRLYEDGRVKKIISEDGRVKKIISEDGRVKKIISKEKYHFDRGGEPRWQTRSSSDGKCMRALLEGEIPF